MHKGGKRWIKPNSLRTEKLTTIERERLLTIKKNNDYMQSVGVKSLVGSVQPKPANACGKELRAEGDDDNDGDYRPCDDEYDNDDEFYGSFEDEVTEMALRKHIPSSQPKQRKAISVLERVTRSKRLDVGTQPSLAPEVEPENEATPSNSVAPVKHARGPTRGLKVQGLVDKEGKLPVRIPDYFRAPVGKYASKLANKIGIEVRSQLPDLSVLQWKAVDSTVKEPMFQRLADQFDMQGDPIVVSKALATKFGRRLSDYTHRLYKQYQKLKNEKGEVYARNNPPEKISLEKWTGLIDKKWNTEKFQTRSRKNTKNRQDMKTKHRCGSKSIPVIVDAQMEDDGDQLQLPKLKDVFKLTHYDPETNQWISEESKILYEKMEQEEAAAAAAGIPMTEEELSVKVLKARSGYVKGLGLRPSSSLRTSIASKTSSEYVTRLEIQLQEQEEKLQAQNNIIAELQEANKRHEESNRRQEEANRLQAEANRRQEEMNAQIMAILRNQGMAEHFKIASLP